MENRRSAGFTLIEVAVALAILALAATALLSVFGAAPTKISRIGNERLAGLAAKSLLARVGGDMPLVAGRSQGVDNSGVRWSLEIEPYGEQQPNPPPPTTPFVVTVRTEAGHVWNQGSASIVTLRIRTP